MEADDAALAVGSALGVAVTGRAGASALFAANQRPAPIGAMLTSAAMIICRRLRDGGGTGTSSPAPIWSVVFSNASQGSVTTTAFGA
jgi:hypothetical protein